MIQSATDALTFTPLAVLTLAVDFQDGHLSSDGDWYLVAEVNVALDLGEPGNWIKGLKRARLVAVTGHPWTRYLQSGEHTFNARQNRFGRFIS